MLSSRITAAFQRGRLCSAISRALSSESTSKAKYQFETLHVTSPKEYVLHVELNRPSKLNAMSPKMFEEIVSCFTAATKDSEVRAIVLSGKGKIFTAGLDLMAVSTTFAAGEGEDTARTGFRLYNEIKSAQEVTNVVEKCRKPVIAAIHNACVGGGVDLSTACDIRLCTDDAFFSVKEVDIGIAADMGTLQRLPKVIGNDSLARELCFTARRMEAAEALKVGLVSHVYKDYSTMIEKAMELATLIAGKSPVAVQGTKVHMNYARDHSTQDSLEYMASWNSAMLQTDDIMKSAEAFMQKKSPSDVVFSKL